MASPLESDDDLVEKLKHGVDHKELEERERAINERIHRQYEQAQTRLAGLIDSNTTLPVTISSVNVLGAVRTRKDFLARIFDPLLSANRDAPYTLAEALAEIYAGGNKLNKFDIFHTPVSIYIDRPDPTIASSTPNDIAVYYSVREKGRVFAKTGTDVGNVEGSAYGYLSWRNLLGGAETLNITGSLGTRTRSAYSVSFSTPVRSDPDVRWEIGALINTLRKDWASHEEVSRGWASKVRWLSGWANHHEIGYSGLWRQNTGLAEHASPGVRADAGDSVKSSLTHVWTSDRRDNATLPTKGYLVKTVNEVAGWGPLRGDVAFWKSELESQVAVPIPVPGVRKDGVTFTAGLRGGLLYPLTLAGQPPRQRQHSRINDRFQLGGPTDVRGFRIAGLGPRDGNDALGGDMYYAGSANLFFPLPRLGPDRPIRLQAFINGGRLVALSTDGGPSTTTTHDRSGSGSGAGAGEDRKGLEGEGAVGAGGSIGGQQRSLIRDTANQLFDGLPSTAAGIGLVYAHPVARFELNFSLPLVLRRGEQGRKGLSFGVGISFL